MTPQTVIDLMQEAFRVSLCLALPALLSAMAVGVAVSLFQAVTSIQEQTLVFVPKMLAVIVVLIVGLSWMLNVVLAYTEKLFQSIPHCLG